MAANRADCTLKQLRRQSQRVAILLFLLTLIYFREQLILGRTLYWGDIGLYFDPMLGFLRENLMRGTVPLWNPRILCGAPYVGNPQTWVLYPSSLLLLFQSSGAAINWTVALHVWFAGMGTYLFLRGPMGRTAPAAVLGAVTFMFGGQLVSKEQFPNMVQAAAYLPWALLAVDRLCRAPSAAASLWLGFLLGMQILAAHQQMVMLTCYLAILYAVPLLAAARNTKHVAHALAGGLGAVCIAALLSLGQVLPSIEFFTHILRQRYTFSIVNRFYLPPNQLLNFIAPTLHGHPAYGSFTARGNFWETCCYVGVVPFALAVMGFVSAWLRREDRQFRFWSIIVVLGTWLAMGGKGRLYYWFFKVLPGFKNFHDPARCLLWACFAVAILAALGADGLLSRAEGIRLTAGRTKRGGRAGWASGRVKCRAAWGVLLVISFWDLARFGATIYPLAHAPIAAAAGHSDVISAIVSDPVVQAHQARIMAPDTARVWQRFTAHRAYRQDAPHYAALWYDTVTPNLGMSAGLYDAYGYDPITRADAQQFLGATVRAFDPQQDDRHLRLATAWAGACGVRYIVLDRIEPPDTVLAGLKTLNSLPTLAAVPPRSPAGRAYLCRNELWQPRARIVTNAVWFGADGTAARRIVATLNGSRPFDPARSTLIAGDDAARPPIPSASSGPIPGAGEHAAALTDLGPDDLIARGGATKPSVLVVADTIHPGWVASVDGRPAPLAVADGFMRAVALPAGDHVVQFRYRPASFLIGLYVSMVTMAGLIAFFLARALLQAVNGQTADTEPLKDAG